MDALKSGLFPSDGESGMMMTSRVTDERQLTRHRKTTWRTFSRRQPRWPTETEKKAIETRNGAR